MSERNKELLARVSVILGWVTESAAADAMGPREERDIDEFHRYVALFAPEQVRQVARMRYCQFCRDLSDALDDRDACAACASKG